MHRQGLLRILSSIADGCKLIKDFQFLRLEQFNGGHFDQRVFSLQELVEPMKGRDAKLLRVLEKRADG